MVPESQLIARERDIVRSLVEASSRQRRAEADAEAELRKMNGSARELLRRQLGELEAESADARQSLRKRRSSLHSHRAAYLTCAGVPVLLLALLLAASILLLRDRLPSVESFGVRLPPLFGSQELHALQFVGVLLVLVGLIGIRLLSYRRGALAMQREESRIDLDYQERSRRLIQANNQELEQFRAHIEEKRRASAARFRKERDGIAIAITKLDDEAAPASPRWDDVRWLDWKPADRTPLLVRLGRIRLTDELEALHVPLLIPFPQGNHLLIKSPASARSVVVETVQSVLARSLAGLPPGRLRFVLLDPVGLGQSLAAFTHLADYDETLIAGRVWTEAHHIEKTLVDLTEHIGNVIQKYLRDQYATLDDYNVQAGEIAEPYRVLAVTDFPVNFTEDAARRLVSIMQNGPRCGVHAVVLVDTDKPVPYGFSLSELERSATVITWDGKRFVWQDEDFEDYELEFDRPPSAELIGRIVRGVGEGAREAGKVEVPFGRIAPMQERWWAGESASGLRVGLGPAGATRIQQLELGSGTAQHALVVGQTGSGKSTLLHVLITNLALTYSPEELEFYLIDFKKGIEFKGYATHRLPHARVIAIESEREFGISVLMGLDGELKRRGDVFRSAGADGLAEYRHKTGEKMGRIVLLVDEFQEFFTEDDAIASQAGQTLDRLVRQGRAFGIHVVLGTQTLAGAYSLARSTIDQMAVRVALQCSEADSRLILADDNSGARLLTRPGDAIYNSANGLVGGNSRFQVAWLADDEQKMYLDRLQNMARQKGWHASPIVFEGNLPPGVETNAALQDLIRGETRPPSSRMPVAWLGEPTAIRDPVATIFRRQSGSNLLIVGRHEEAVLGTVSVAIVSLCAQMLETARRKDDEIDERPHVHVIDFIGGGDPETDVLSRLAKLMRGRVKYWRPRHLAEVIEVFELEVGRRLACDDLGAPSLFLFVHGLQRARDLRQEEDIAYAPGGEGGTGLSLVERFMTVVREGPDFGVHSVVWCDTLTNLTRSVDRRGLREFAVRVVSQMSAEDSVSLIDTPAANKLGPERALLYDEGESHLEKFRPYAVPKETWLAWASDKIVRTTKEEGSEDVC